MSKPTTRSANPNLALWKQFLSRCLASRLDDATFVTYIRFQSSKYPLGSSEICELFLGPVEVGSEDGEQEDREDRDQDGRMEAEDCMQVWAPDPRVVGYVLCMLNEGIVTVQRILQAMWRVSSLRRFVGHDQGGLEVPKKNHQMEVKRKWENSFSAEETLFYRLAKHVSANTTSGNTGTGNPETVGLIQICISWMELALGLPPGTNVPPPIAQEIAAQNMALGALVVAIVENPGIQRAISKTALPKNIREGLEKCLGRFGFPALIMQNAPPVAARLEGFVTGTLPGLAPVKASEKEEKKEGGGAEKEMDDLLGGVGGLGMGLNAEPDTMIVEEVPIMNSRAGLYIYLNSLLVGRPLIDDHAIYAYLQNRYQGDLRSTMVDLILASFDILANATFKNEKAQSTTLLRSFLINKIPLLLSALSSGLFPPLTPEYCITEALSHVDTTAFPTLSNMFDESSVNNMFSDSVRQDFCFACCLHGLIAEESIEGLLGDVPMQSLPAGGRYVKEDLVQQCLSDPERAEALIAELEQMDGNVGAVSEAITEVIASLCRNKETMSLKSLCARIARKPSSLDVMLLFDKPATILQPIVDLLDNWRYDEDQGEYQPVYEEFGSILLLVLSFTYRYNLSHLDLGIRTQDSFILKLLTQDGWLSKTTDELTSVEQKHLDGWIRGLFDAESGGLGDELMSSCPPQDFYLLIPTLFQHIVLAYSTKNLSDDGLKGGLEYLVDTFLLPSLIPGINWLSSHLWESRGDTNAVLQILSVLITNPTSISNNTEASQMLTSILNIIAKNLEHSLRWLQRAEPSRQDVEPLSRALRPSLGWERRGASDHTELETWTATPHGGLTAAIKSTIHFLVHWAANPTMNSNPASYTHRQVLVGMKLLGAKRLLVTIIEEIKTISTSDPLNAALVYDVAVAIVCAPDPGSWDAESNVQPFQRRLTLREALKAEADTAPKLHKTDEFTANTVTTLWRKVEAQMLPQLALHETLEGAMDAAAAGMGVVDVGGVVAALDIGMGDGLDMHVGLDGSGLDTGGMEGGMGEHDHLMQDMGLMDGVGNGVGMDGSGDLFGDGGGDGGGGGMDTDLEF